MTESEFNQRYDDTLISIEEVLDEAETDIDYLNQGGVLTVICENRSQVIFTRQAPVKQLWVATKSGGFHFDWDAQQNTWVRDSDQAPLAPFLSETFAEQAGERFEFGF